ncbi:MAG: hypothetical protein ACNA8W_25225, partial [Bradymonadaceae bacterium]
MTTQHSPPESPEKTAVHPLTRDAHIRIHDLEVETAGLEELVEFVCIDTNGITLHAALAGP